MYVSKSRTFQVINDGACYNSPLNSIINKNSLTVFHKKSYKNLFLHLRLKNQKTIMVKNKNIRYLKKYLSK